MFSSPIVVNISDQYNQISLLFNIDEADAAHYEVAVENLCPGTKWFSCGLPSDDMYYCFNWEDRWKYFKENYLLVETIEEDAFMYFLNMVNET